MKRIEDYRFERCGQKYKTKYFNALQQLFSEKIEMPRTEPSAKTAQLKTVKRQSVEANDVQIPFAAWLEKQGIEFYAIPNGGKRNAFEGAKFKRMGVKAGAPDLCIPIPSGAYHGLYIELKREGGGKLSDSQKYWIDLLNKRGYYAVVAVGLIEAKNIVLQYLDLTPKAA